LCFSPGCNLPIETLRGINDMDTKEIINFYQRAGDKKER
jgi:hypothetical protein